MHEHDTDHDVDGPGTDVRRRDAEADTTATQHALAEGDPRGVAPSSVAHLQRAAGNASVTRFVQRDEDEHPVKDVIGSGRGHPLEPDVRNDMEQRLGHDFADVRVHTDAQAAASAKSVQAKAYTSGNEIVFDDGQYAPGTSDGAHTLAHELTHVVQQRSGPVDGTPAAGGIRVSDPTDQYERAAERSADVATGEAAAPTAGPATAPAVQRQDAPVEEEPEEPEVGRLQRQVPEEEVDEEEGAPPGA